MHSYPYLLFYPYLFTNDQLREFETSDAIPSVNVCVERQGSTSPSTISRTELLFGRLVPFLISTPALLYRLSIALPTFLDLSVDEDVSSPSPSARPPTECSTSTPTLPQGPRRECELLPFWSERQLLARQPNESRDHQLLSRLRDMQFKFDRESSTCLSDREQDSRRDVGARLRTFEDRRRGDATLLNKSEMLALECCARYSTPRHGANFGTAQTYLEWSSSSSADSQIGTLDSQSSIDSLICNLRAFEILKVNKLIS